MKELLKNNISYKFNFSQCFYEEYKNQFSFSYTYNKLKLKDLITNSLHAGLYDTT